ncbi:cation:proton antiporter [Proteobacteria bacterium 005FR1]|nr:cation:proton antiporter [Proteobacteria bacterium 005FR1]
MDFVHASLFYELTALLALAAALGFAGMLLRQPMVVSLIAVGVLAGPSGLDLVRSRENVELLAELGIAVLLFLVGLKLDIKLIRTLGPVALATGLGQVAFTSLFGFFLGLALGLDTVTSVYVAVALTFSSTIIIVKLLSDKREVDSLHGRIAIGFLIVQDVVVVIAMIVLSGLGIGQSAADSAGPSSLGGIFISGVFLIAFVWLFVRYAANPLMRRVARSPELLIIAAIGWAAIMASIANYLGLSKELGGLLAGVALASTPFREGTVARLSPLRDFLLLFFFIELGSQLDLGLLGDQIDTALVFSVFVLIGNPLIVMAIMGLMGYRKRTGFLAGLTVAQISEFSLIFVAMGMEIGHLDAEALGLVTLVGLITIALSVYMITYSHHLYRWLEPVLDVFEGSKPYRELMNDRQTLETPCDVVLFGLGRYGNAIAEQLRRRGMCVLAVDFNPEEVRRWRRLGLNAVYGDASDQNFIASLDINRVPLVISAMPQHDLGLTHEDPRIALIEALKQQDYPGKIVVSAHRSSEVETLRASGAHVVLSPFIDAAELAVEKIQI